MTWASLCKDALRRGIYLVEIIRADKLLQHRDVWVVRLVEREPLRKGLEQMRVGGLRVLDHRRVGFERDVDRRHRVLLGDRPLDKRHRQPQPEPKGGDDFQMFTHACLAQSRWLC